jgi:hypothetical protein
MRKIISDLKKEIESLWFKKLLATSQ